MDRFAFDIWLLKLTHLALRVWQFVPANKRVAQMARLRLEYDEARKRRIDLQKKLAYLEDNQSSGLDNSAMCDHDRSAVIFLF